MSPPALPVLTPYAPLPFSYAFPEQHTPPTRGAFVQVNLRGRDVIGVVWSDTLDNTIPPHRLKKATILSHIPPLSPNFLAYLSRAHTYTMGGLGQWMRLVIPSPHILAPTRKKKNTPPPTPSPIHLNPDQKSISDTLSSLIQSSQFSPVLLEGITGSGKTETYLSPVPPILSRQTLILLPEILLAEQTFARTQKIFGNHAALWHSELTPATRRDTWQRWAQGSLPILVGTRSALHLPSPRLALIIIDEEHDNGYKQEEGGAIYHARDIAVLRAQCEHITIVLSSATPSFETLYNVQIGRYQHFTLSKRFGNASLPSLSIHDTQNTEICPPQHTISLPLKEKILNRISHQQQVLLFLNRRGYAPVVLCTHCGTPLACPHDQHVLALHLPSKKNLKDHSLLDGIFFKPPPDPSPLDTTHIPPHARLLCHLCGSSHSLPPQCPQCSKPSSSFIPKGWGVERIASEVAAFAPHARIAIATSDTLSKKKELKSFLNHMENHTIDIVIGTQLIAKGLHFPKLTLVGIINAQQGFNGIDFRNHERCFQMTHQVSGRSGRDPLLKGEVVIQTHDLDSPLAQALKDINNPSSQQQFIQNEMNIRKQAQLPPYSFYASLILSSSHLKTLENTCRHLYKNAPPTPPHITLFPPIPAPIPFVRNTHRFRFLIKSLRPQHPQPFISEWLQHHPLPSQVRLHIDIDPFSFL